MDEKLLPCPFCRCEQIGIYLPDGKHQKVAEVHCAGCGACFRFQDLTNDPGIKYCIKNWNTRAAMPSQDNGELVGEIEIQIKILRGLLEEGIGCVGPQEKLIELFENCKAALSMKGIQPVYNESTNTPIKHIVPDDTATDKYGFTAYGDKLSEILSTACWLQAERVFTEEGKNAAAADIRWCIREIKRLKAISQAPQDNGELVGEIEKRLQKIQEFAERTKEVNSDSSHHYSAKQVLGIVAELVSVKLVLQDCKLSLSQPAIKKHNSDICACLGCEENRRYREALEKIRTAKFGNIINQHWSDVSFLQFIANLALNPEGEYKSDENEG